MFFIGVRLELHTLVLSVLYIRTQRVDSFRRWTDLSVLDDHARENETCCTSTRSSYHAEIIITFPS